MLKRIEKSKQIRNENINKEYEDPEMLIVDINSNGKIHQVTFYNDLWRCDCEDFQYRGVNHEEGSYLCKHILRVIKELHDGCL